MNFAAERQPRAVLCPPGQGFVMCLTPFLVLLGFRSNPIRSESLYWVLAGTRGVVRAKRVTRPFRGSSDSAEPRPGRQAEYPGSRTERERVRLCSGFRGVRPVLQANAQDTFDAMVKFST